jgi:septal ring-binding cell division protein DamX
MRLSPSSLSALFAAVLLVLAVPACTPSAVVGEGGDDEDPQEKEVDLSQYEDFDPAPYREEAPAAREEIEHDVPARLLSGSADEGVEQTVRGYRVQVLSSRDQSAAEGAARQAAQWWRANAGEAPSGLFASDDLPVYTIYRQPYYRVRVGNFTERAEAERALEFLRQRYGDAFIVRGEVVVTR